jgi:hypothetical protein
MGTSEQGAVAVGIKRAFLKSLTARYWPCIFFALSIQQEWTRCVAILPADFFTFIASLARVCPARAECPENPNRQNKPWADQKNPRLSNYKAVEKISPAFCLRRPPQPMDPESDGNHYGRQ